MKPYLDVKRLSKSTTHRKISGVCAGLAEHWGVPRFLVRAGAIVCLIAFPKITAIAYISASLILPNR